MDIIESRIRDSISNLQRLLLDEAALKQIADAARLVIGAMKAGNKIMICGNGGSAGDAQHMAGDLVCRFCKDRDPLPAIALSTDTSVLTAISNDYCYGDVFSRQVKGLGKRGDVVLGISTSGASVNILDAFKEARRLGIKTILLTGSTESGSGIEAYCDIVLAVPSSDTPRIQEIHLLVEHMICELVENELCGQN